MRFDSVKYLIAALYLFSGSALPSEPLPPGCGTPDPYSLVYTRQLRYTDPVLDKSGKVIRESGAQWQDFYDAGQPDVFSEGDLVLDDLQGKRKVLFNCTAQDRICNAHDARVSHDASQIMFTVAYGDSFRSPNHLPAGAKLTRDIEFKATRYELWLYTAEKGKSRKIADNARMGEWAGGGKIVFASNRAGTFAPMNYAGIEYPDPALHIFIADFDGEKLGPATDLTPHAAYCMSPAVNLDGSIAMSCWEGWGERGKGHTPANMWWLWQVEGNSTDWRVIAGAHGSPYYWKTNAYLADVCQTTEKGQVINCGEASTSFRVMRQYTPLWGDDYLFTNYYRSNHTGAYGAIFRCKRSDVEGFTYSASLPDSTLHKSIPGSGRFAPNCYVATPFGNDADNTVKFNKNGKAMGKAGDPFAIPLTKGKFGFTMARGNCYSPSGADRATTEAFGGEPTCKKEIRVAVVDRVTDPFDIHQSYCIAGCWPQHNAYGARYVAPYKALLGQDPPPAPPAILEGKTTTLQIVNARTGEIHQIDSPSRKPEDDCAIQGCAVDGWQEKITAIHIEQVLPHIKRPSEKGFSATQPIGNFPIRDDGSLSFEIPCGINYQLWGVGKDGKMVAKDNTIHSAVCGEVVTCHGCHDAHSIQRAKELGPAVPAFQKTEAGRE